MIQAERTAKPQSLVDHADTWKQDYLNARIAENEDPTADNKKRRAIAEDKYTKKDIKKSLNEMFCCKCAFCERRRDYPHIEHYYPKSKFPEKCFEWENLLLACEVCNGPEFKGTKFPFDMEGHPLLINPCLENPDEHLEFVFEEDAAHPDGFIAVVRDKTLKGKITRETLGLNRANLIIDRNELLPYCVLAAIEAGKGDEKAKRLLRKACEPKSTFAAFARSLWRQYVGKYP